MWRTHYNTLACEEPGMRMGRGPSRLKTSEVKDRDQGKVTLGPAYSRAVRQAEPETYSIRSLKVCTWKTCFQVTSDLEQCFNNSVWLFLLYSTDLHGAGTPLFHWWSQERNDSWSSSHLFHLGLSLNQICHCVEKLLSRYSSLRVWWLHKGSLHSMYLQVSVRASQYSGTI